MNNLEKNTKIQIENMNKAADVLRYSYNKCCNIKIQLGMDYEKLDSLEALTSRFARLSDIIIQKMFRLIEIIDLESQGTVRDRINSAEKKGIINSADLFIEIRILRNEIAHEYQTSTIMDIFEKVLEYTPALLESVGKVESYLLIKH